MTPDPKDPARETFPTPAPGWSPEPEEAPVPDEQSNEIPKHNPKHKPAYVPLPAD